MLRAIVLWLGCLGASATEAPEAGEPPRDSMRRIHDVHDLLGASRRLDWGPWPHGGDLELVDGRAAWGVPFEMEPEGVGSDPELRPSPRLGLQGAELCQLLRAHVAPGTWDVDGVSLKERGHVLDVVHSSEVQGETARFLGALRAWRGRRFLVEMAQIPARALEGGAARVGEMLPAGDFESILGRAGAKARYGAFLLRDGQSTRRFAGRVRASLTDYEVNQTGALPVTNPVVDAVPLGQGFTIAVTSAAPGPWVLLGIEASRVRETAEAERRQTPLGELELLELRRDALDTTVLLRSGAAALLGISREAVDGGPPTEFAWLARVSEVPLASEGYPPAESVSVHRVHPGGWLLWPPSGGLLPTGAPFSSELGYERLLRAVVGDLRRELGRGLREEAGAAVESAILTVHGGRIVVTAAESVHRALEEHLAKRFQERASRARVRIDVLEGTAGDVLAAGTGTLGSDWRSTDPVRRLRSVASSEILGTPGADIQVRAFSCRHRLVDCEWMSGGCSGGVLAAPDPIVVSAGTGLRVCLRVDRSRRLDRIGLRLELSLSRARRGEPARVLVPSDLQRPLSDGDAAVADEGAAIPGVRRVSLPWEIDRVQEAGSRIEDRFLLRADRPSVLLRELPGDGTGRLVVVTAEWVPAAPGGEM